MAQYGKFVNKQFNSPIGLYSETNIKDVLDRESQILQNGAIGIDFHNPSVNKPANLQHSAVLRFLEEEEQRKRGGSPSIKRVVWPPPPEAEGHLAEVSVQEVGRPQISSSGLQNNHVPSPTFQQGPQPAPHESKPTYQEPQLANVHQPLAPASYKPGHSVGARSPSPYQIPAYQEALCLQSPKYQKQAPQPNYSHQEPQRNYQAPQSPTVHQPNYSPQPAPQPNYQEPQSANVHQPLAPASHKPGHSVGARSPSPYQIPAYQEALCFQPPKYQKQAPQPNYSHQEPQRNYQAPQSPTVHQPNYSPQPAPQPNYQEPQSANVHQPLAPASHRPGSRVGFQRPQSPYQLPAYQEALCNQAPQFPNQPLVSVSNRPGIRAGPPSPSYQPQSPSAFSPAQPKQWAPVHTPAAAPPQPKQYQPPQDFQPPVSQVYQHQPPPSFYKPTQQSQTTQTIAQPEPPQQTAPLQFQAPAPRPELAQQQQQQQARAPTQQRQAPPQYYQQPAKPVEPPPSTITLRPEAPVSQVPVPVYTSQPATATLKGGKHLRGDLKWPPPETREKIEAENKHIMEIARGPGCRPRKVRKDYTQFFAQNALNNAYPGYKVPPGTQFYVREDGA